MLRLIEDVLEADTQKSCPVTGRYLPDVPIMLWEHRLRDAWAVFRCRAVAVQWPDQKEKANG